jgi:hypothetical protein
MSGHAVAVMTEGAVLLLLVRLLLLSSGRGSQRLGELL